MTINTSYWAKPIPDSRYDWEAVADGYDAGDPVGYGQTKQAAIVDLQQQLEDEA